MPDGHARPHRAPARRLTQFAARSVRAPRRRPSAARGVRALPLPKVGPAGTLALIRAAYVCSELERSATCSNLKEPMDATAQMILHDLASVASRREYVHQAAFAKSADGDEIVILVVPPSGYYAIKVEEVKKIGDGDQAAVDEGGDSHYPGVTRFGASSTHCSPRRAGAASAPGCGGSSRPSAAEPLPSAVEVGPSSLRPRATRS